MTYKYCTKKMVDKAVKQGREAVIKCASDKWWFFGTCTEKQFSRICNYGLSGNCAMCALFNPDTTYGACEICPCQPYCEKDYQRAVDLRNYWNYNPTATNFKKFQAKARKLARVIGRLK